MNWSVAINALCFPQPPTVDWPGDRRRVVQLLGSTPQCKPKPPRKERPPVPTDVARIAFSDAALVEAMRDGRVTGPASIGLLFGMSASSGHRHLTRLVASGRLARVSWGQWRIVD